MIIAALAASVSTSASRAVAVSSAASTTTAAAAAAASAVASCCFSSFGATGGGVVRFGRAVLTVRGGAEGVASAVHFYQAGLGLDVLRHTDDWAELACGVVSGGEGEGDDGRGGAASALTLARAFRVSIKAVESEAHLSVGYAPILSFDVADMDGTVARCIQLGGHLDGPIQYPAHGKVAALRSPDGHMIGLYEPASSSSSSFS